MKRFFLRLYFEGAMLGPGKAELLERIAETGSISAAGRAMGMSYKRAWSLVEEMNDAFTAPLVESSRGGRRGGGAQLTTTGEAVRRLFRSIESKAQEAAQSEIAELESLLASPMREDSPPA